MTGRLENQIKTEQKIKRTLKSLPQIVADFYYNISTSTEPKSCYMYIMIIKGFIEFIEELNISINDIDEKAKVRKDTQHYYSGTYSYDQRISHELVIYPIEVVFQVIYAV